MLSHERVDPGVVLRRHQPPRAQAGRAHHLARLAAHRARLPIDQTRPSTLTASEVPAPLAVEALVLLPLRHVVHLNHEEGGQHAHGAAHEGRHNGIHLRQLPREPHRLDELEVRETADAQPDPVAKRGLGEACKSISEAMG